jgi:hypothetical protein
MKKVLFLSLFLFPLYAFGADEPKSVFLTTTISDLGRPYTVIDGECSFGKSTSIMGREFESAFEDGANRLDAKAAAHGANAIVGMQATPVSESIDGGRDTRNGVLVCGTFVKFK